jgi:chromosomal replication initiation ATPase DnaA
MASDRPPAEIADVDERLVTRSRVADRRHRTAGYETRVAILRNKCAEREMTFASVVLEELAQCRAAASVSCRARSTVSRPTRR